MKHCTGKARRWTQLVPLALMIGLAVLASAHSADAQTTTTPTVTGTPISTPIWTPVPTQPATPFPTNTPLPPTNTPGPSPTSTPRPPTLTPTPLPPTPTPTPLPPGLTFISAPNRVDMVPDPLRAILYITTGSQGEVLRYSLETHQFLTPFTLGGNLMGIDLSPDANTLAVADSSFSSGQGWIHLVNLQTGKSQKVTFPADHYEGGTFTVAYGNDGRLLITSRFQGSGWVPLRRYDPATGAVSSIFSVCQDTMLSGSADGSIIGFAESNISSGDWGRYRVADGDIVERWGYTEGTGWSNYEIGTNRNGTQFAIPTYGGTYIYDSNYTKIATLGVYAGPQPIGVVYHPSQDIVYFAWEGTQEVRGFETTTFTQVSAYNMGYTFQWTGNHAFTQGHLRMSRDGAMLFATTGGGVGYVYTVTADINGLIADKERACAVGWISDKSVCNTLGNKLAEAKQAIDQGKIDTAKRKLSDFISELDAQLGKAVNLQAYDLLKPEALYVMDHLP